eukprot:311373-Prymnesium_polylepis.1
MQRPIQRLRLLGRKHISNLWIQQTRCSTSAVFASLPSTAMRPCGDAPPSGRGSSPTQPSQPPSAERRSGGTTSGDGWKSTPRSGSSPPAPRNHCAMRRRDSSGRRS